jgi:hypothetical protein
MVHPLANIMRSPREVVRAGYVGTAKLYAVLYCEINRPLVFNSGETSDINGCL